MDTRTENFIKTNEGSVMENGLHKAYQCPADKLTIGYGHNLDAKGISEEVAMAILREDIATCVADLKKVFPDFNDLPDSVRMVLTDMIFVLGYRGFTKFKRFIAAVRDLDGDKMVAELKDSTWYRTYGRSRLEKYFKILRS